MMEDLWFQRLPDGRVVQVWPKPYSWAAVDAEWKVASPVLPAVCGRNAMDVISVESFLNDCHWPWAVDGLQTRNVNLERGCGHREVQELPFSTTVEDLLRLQRVRCANCQAKVDARFKTNAEDARRRAREADLPPIIGVSERQADFAYCVRDKALLRFGRAGDFLVVAQTVCDATWWIDNRSRTGHLKVFSEMARGLTSGS